MLTLTVVAQAWIMSAVSKLDREEGQDFAEYAIIFALVVVVAAAAFTPLGTAIRDKVQAVADGLAASSF